MDATEYRLRPDTLAMTPLPLTPRLAALLRAIEIASGEGNPPSITALARRADMTTQRIWNWLNRNGFVPLDCVPAISRATGNRVTCEELWPDYDWEYIRAAAAPQAAEQGVVTT